MKRKIYVDDSLFKSLAGFIESEGIQIDLTADNAACVRVLTCDGKNECNLDTLYSGGWIACRTALNLAEKLEIPTIQIGALLNHLKIKIKHCSLGCFQ